MQATADPAIDPRLLDIARAVAAAGGRAIVVGGFVRDRLLKIRSKDIDVEVFGMAAEALEALLERFGECYAVGRSFGVYKLKGVDADFSLPRRDSKIAPGHRGFEVTVDTTLDFEQAARRRDFTLNSMGLDPLTGELLDPHRGQADLDKRLLRATDAAHFAEDPLRGMRAAQFIARFGLAADAELLRLCHSLDLTELPGERLLEEFRKLLLKGTSPSRGLQFLADTSLISYFPELAALMGVPQDPRWHPEGDVWVHTLMVLDVAASLRTGTDDEALMFAALCHDLGKPQTTEKQGNIVRSHAHDRAGVPLTRALLERLRAPEQLIKAVAVLVDTHLAPALLAKQGAGPKAYRRLARKLEAAGAGVELLERVARADHLGRTTPDAVAGTVPWLRTFRAEARGSLEDMRAPRAIVSGKYLIERGFEPGPHLGEIITACRDIQDETGSTDPGEILAQALAARGEPYPG